MERDSNSKSLWQTAEPMLSTDMPGDLADTIHDVVIIGAGITGISLALKLQEAGHKCMVVEAHSIGYGTSGGTTAHLNTVLDSPYSDMIRKFDVATAKLIAQGATDSIRDILDNIHRYNISCDLEQQRGFLYAGNDSQAEELDKMKDAMDLVGIQAMDIQQLDLPVEFEKAIVFEGQAQFNPMKYILALAAVFRSKGGFIMENTRVTDVSAEDNLRLVSTSQGQCRAMHVVYATHIPTGINVLHFKCAPYRSYVIGVKLADPVHYPDGLYYDMEDPYHYFRTAIDNDGPVLLIGGMDHKTGHEQLPPADAYTQLEALAKSLYNISEVRYRWSSQYYEPADGLPYIGPLPGAASNIYCATGFSGNGMIFGTMSAIVIAGLISGQNTPLAKVLSPARLKLVASFSQMVKENSDVIKHFVADRISIEQLSEFTELSKEEGKVVRYEGGTIAIYKDSNGKLNALKPVCPHAGCIVQWNGPEKSWDCPCHGARYDISGKMLNGPSDKDLEAIELT
jgi:glycine/D-amino acid oxidase-like deaminating enzyme/nitrite reductase/ring-hydroxylating ferredoxin subunit